MKRMFFSLAVLVTATSGQMSSAARDVTAGQCAVQVVAYLFSRPAALIGKEIPPELVPTLKRILVGNRTVEGELRGGFINTNKGDASSNGSFALRAGLQARLNIIETELREGDVASVALAGGKNPQSQLRILEEIGLLNPEQPVSPYSVATSLLSAFVEVPLELVVGSRGLSLFKRWCLNRGKQERWANGQQLWISGATEFFDNLQFHEILIREGSETANWVYSSIRLQYPAFPPTDIDIVTYVEPDLGVFQPTTWVILRRSALRPQDLAESPR